MNSPGPVQFVPSSNGTRIALHDFGGDGPPLLWSHATGLCAAVAAPVHAHLAGEFHGWALDYRAHGHSTRPTNGDLSWQRYADDAVAVCERMGRPLVAFGHSMGGAALLMAELRNPGTFAGLVIYEPIVFPPELMAVARGGPNPLSEGARRRRRRFDSYDAALANFASKPPMNAFDPDCLEAYVRCGFRPELANGSDGDVGGVTLRCRREDEAATFENGSSHDTWNHLGSIRCPVLVLAGRSDGGGPADFAERSARELPESRFERLESLSHFGPLENPALLAERMRSFLG